MQEEIRKILQQAVKKLKQKQKLTFKVEKIQVDYPKNEAFGDYTSNIAMILANQIKKAPLKIAEEIVNLMKKDESLVSNMKMRFSMCFKKIEIVKPGYINFYFSQEYLQKLIQKVNKEKDSFGNSKKEGKKIMVEYSQPNTHKEFHIGHLRNVFIGNALVNILAKTHNQVISTNYIGDTGTHIAKCLWGINKFYKNTDLNTVKNKAEFLGKVYSQATREIKNHPEYENDFKKVQKRFEAGDKKLINLWGKTKQWSLDEFQEIYEKLGVKFDVYFWESEEEKAGKKMLPELLGKSFIKKSQGAIIADLEKYNLGILVLVRKDGSVLYGLKDIALAIKKFQQYKIDKSIIVVDIRQKLYLKQIFKILELLDVKGESQHIGYEFVSLKGNETMSSRKGNIIPAKLLMGEIIKKVKEKFPQTEIADEIGLGALKFYMLKYSAQRKIEFDMEEAIRLDGATGPYVQYAYARVCSILEKVKRSSKRQSLEVSEIDLKKLVHKKEIDLIRELNKFIEIVEDISENYEIHKLPYYAIALADKFHSFYSELKVLDEENLPLTKARLELVKSVRIVLREALTLMGISAPERM
jgi:arginyl-tRNA synthetase